MVSVISGWEDPEKVQAVQVAGPEQSKDTVITYRVGTEFEASALITGVHNDCKQSARPESLTPIAVNLHSYHGACKDHVDRLGDVDQFAHTETVEESLERGTVSPLTYCGVKSDSRTDIEQSYRVGGRDRTGSFCAGDGLFQRLVGKGIQKRRLIVIGDPAYIAGADSFPPENGIYQFASSFFDPEALDQVVAGTGLYKTDPCMLKILNAVNYGVHCAVSAKYDQIAVLTAGGEFLTDLFYSVVGR